MNRIALFFAIVFVVILAIAWVVFWAYLAEQVENDYIGAIIMFGGALGIPVAAFCAFAPV
jgi:hypothetical protein